MYPPRWQIGVLPKSADLAAKRTAKFVACCQTEVHKKKVQVIASTQCSQQLSSKQRVGNFFKSHIHLVKTHCSGACFFNSAEDCAVKLC